MNKLYGSLVGVVIALLVWIVTGIGTAGERKGFVPPEVYKELVAREAKILQQSLKDSPKDAQLARARLAAVMIARLALDAQLEEGTGGVEETALKVAKLLGNKDMLGAARKLADSLPGVSGGGKLENFDARPLVGEASDTMDHLRPKKKGGDGIHADLQTSGPLKNLNGIEEKVRSLAKKKLSDAALKKSAYEMVLLGYRTAVLAEVVNDFAPAQNAKLWRDLSAQMRSAGINLARASEKKDAAAIFKAGASLDASCNNCHSKFRQ